MMGSGKTTVGKIMSQALSYSFCDWLVYINFLSLFTGKDEFPKHVNCVAFDFFLYQMYHLNRQ